MTFRHGDPHDDFDRYDAEMERRLARRPVCSCCKKHIQDEEALHFGAIWLCSDCVEDNTEYIEVDE